MSKGGGGGGTVVQRNEPPKYLIPYLKETADASKAIYDKGVQPLYPGQTFAGMNDIQDTALQNTLGLVNDPTMLNSAKGYYQGVLDTPSGQNPYLDQLLEKYGAKANAMVASNFNSAGRYASGAHAGTAGREISDATLPFLFDQFNKDEQNKALAAQGLTGLNSAFLNNQAVAGGVGDTYQAYDQNKINEEMQRYDYEHGGGEKQLLEDYIARINGNAGTKFGTTTQTSSTPGGGIGSTIGGIVSGLGTIGGLGTGLSSWLGGGSALASALGGSSGILGSIAGLAGIFSDERLKENIEIVGTENGHNVYEFNYRNGSGRRYRGVMAQEVLKKHPEAVSESKGFLTVDYSKIGVKFHEVGAHTADRAAGAHDSRGGTVETSAPAGIGAGAPFPNCRGL